MVGKKKEMCERDKRNTSLVLASFLLVIIGYSKIYSIVPKYEFGPVRSGPYYVPHIIITYNDSVDMDILCYRTTGTYPCIVLLLDYVYKVLDGVE